MAAWERLTAEAHVTVDIVLDNLRRNAELAKKIISAVVPQIPAAPNWSCHAALHNSIMTDKKLWPAKTKKELAPLLAKYL